MDHKPIDSQSNSMKKAVSNEAMQYPSIQLQPNINPYDLPDNQMIYVNVPGSKSITNRILLIAALGNGKVRVGNFWKSTDTIAMMSALKQLQLATFELDPRNEHVLIVNGNGGKGSGLDKSKDLCSLHVSNSGTAGRFLTTLAVVISGKTKKPVQVTGNEQIKKRPIDSLVDALISNGCKIAYSENPGCLPLSIESPDGFPGGHIKLDAQISSQYVSSILLCAPYANDPVKLELVGSIVSRSYIDMTIALMKSFGITVTQPSENIFEIPKGSYKNPPEFTIEPDASTASYPMAVAAITGKSVKIAHLGKSSLQGDAGFAPQILAAMGCTVIQTESYTVVHGRPVGTLKSFGSVDMGPLTDTFLTAAVLAAVAPGGVSTITGIANQRVKECNRISAVASQLAKFGVQTEELSDGIKIYGKSYEEMKDGASIHCFDDHRVAMSFSVLGCLVPCVIRDRFCTKKTWPEWWDVLNGTLNINLDPVDVMNSAEVPASDDQVQGCAETSTPTVVLIGMRGVGKTMLGRNVAKLLAKNFVDMDEEFCVAHKISGGDYITKNGFDAFRTLESDLLKSLLAKYPSNSIISCGGGIVETKPGRRLLENLKKSSATIIIHLIRRIEEIMQDPTFWTKVAYPEDVITVWKRRLPWYQECCTKEIYINHNTKFGQTTCTWKQIELQMSKFITNCYFPNCALNSNVITSKTTSPTVSVYSIPCQADYDHSVSLIERWRSEHIEIPNKNNFPELRVVAEKYFDLEIQKHLDEIGQNYFLLKRVSQIPVVLTYTESRNNGCPSLFTNLLVQSAIKWNVDILCLDEPLKLKLDAETKSLIHGSNSNIITGTLYKGPDLDSVLNMSKNPEPIQPETDQEPEIEFKSMVEIIQIDFDTADTPLKGRFLVSNCFQPAPFIPLGIKDVNSRLTMLNELTPKQFCLFGSPISASRSPLLHNTGFTAVGLPYVYQIHETSTLDPKTIQFLTSPNFGGGSFTIPLKEKIIKELDRITTAGKIIGAINTIFINENGKLVGDNTDYLGMLKVIEPTLESKPAGKSLRGLVIGGGGTCRAAIYALLSIPQIGHITVVNRNVGKVQALIEEFKGVRPNSVELHADSLDSLNCACFDDLHHPHIIISTIPYDAQVESCRFSKELFKNVFVVVEMVYAKKTPFLAAVEQYSGKGQEGPDEIVICDGAQVLIEQGLKQFEMWTGLNTPFEFMRSVVLKSFGANV